MRKRVVAVEPVGERGQRALDLADGGFAGEDRGAGAAYLNCNDSGAVRQRGGDDEARAEGGALVVNFRLRQIEGIFALDVARAHVIAERVAEDFSGGIDRKREFGLGHVPL